LSHGFREHEARCQRTVRSLAHERTLVVEAAANLEEYFVKDGRQLLMVTEADQDVEIATCWHDVSASEWHTSCEHFIKSLHLG
jgi:hypothetical protein